MNIDRIEWQCEDKDDKKMEVAFEIKQSAKAFTTLGAAEMVSVKCTIKVDNCTMWVADDYPIFALKGAALVSIKNDLAYRAVRKALAAEVKEAKLVWAE